jgi:hypothetical protein
MIRVDFLGVSLNQFSRLVQFLASEENTFQHSDFPPEIRKEAPALFLLFSDTCARTTTRKVPMVVKLRSVKSFEDNSIIDVGIDVITEVYCVAHDNDESRKFAVPSKYLLVAYQILTS